jgi:hypothetical protein
MPDETKTPEDTSERTTAPQKQSAAKKSPAKKTRKRRTKKRASKGAAKAPSENKRGGQFQGKPFPTATFESVLPLAQAIFEYAGALREMLRETVFGKLNKSSQSGQGRTLIINSGRYGLTIGGYKADVLKLSDKGALVVDPATPPATSMRAKFSLAIEGIAPFNGLYEKFKGGKLPAPEVMKDALHDVDVEDRQECVDIFIGNLKYIGLLKLISGAEWILSIEEALKELGDSKDTPVITGRDAHTDSREEAQTTIDYDSICFFLAPIGEEGDDQRKHSDMVLETLLDHALQHFKLKVIRADRITQPGMISKQIIEHILKSKLVVADMSFHNPNAFYELAIRHMLGRPIVHIIRKRDRIPFDVGNFRTIMIDDEDKYDLIAKLDSYRADIANYVREALEGSSSADNPILTYFPDMTVTFSGNNR